jgi:hypothetical protein
VRPSKTQEFKEESRPEQPKKKFDPNYRRPWRDNKPERQPRRREYDE